MLEKTLESPLNRKIKPVNSTGNQPWTFIGSTDSVSLKWNSNILATWCKNAIHWKTLMRGKVECKRRRQWQRMRWLDNITNSIEMNLSKLQEIVEDREAWGAAVYRVPKSRTRYSDWATPTINPLNESLTSKNITRPQDGSLVGMPS